MPLTSHCSRHQASEVPDPYYGGEQGFEHVLDLLEDACSIEEVVAQIVALFRERVPVEALNADA